MVWLCRVLLDRVGSGMVGRMAGVRQPFYYFVYFLSVSLYNGNERWCGGVQSGGVW